MSISNAVDPSARARAVGIKTEFKNLRGSQALSLPQRVALIGQGNTAKTFSTEKRQVTSASEVGSLVGYGSPAHLAAQQLFPANGDGVGTIPVTLYPLADAGTGVAATASITPTGTLTQSTAFRINIGGVKSDFFSLAAGTSAAGASAAITAAITAITSMPMTAVDGAGSLALTSKWKGDSANGLKISIEGDSTLGLTFAIVQPSGGLIDPDVQPALDQIGDSWETIIVNCLGSSAAAKIQTYGDGRWGALTRKPFVSVFGTGEADVSTVATITDARPTDKVNALLPVPGSSTFPAVIAARAVARIAQRANTDPARDYGSLLLEGVEAGSDFQQWTYPQRDLAIKAGASSTKLSSGLVALADTVTMYHPEGDPDPAYRYVVDIVKLQNILYNVDRLFANTEWDGAPLVPDGTVLTSRSAKTPSMAKAALATLADSLASAGILSDAAFTKANLVAAISDQNPKRLDIVFPVKLSGNANIISVDLDFGFYFNN